MFICLLYLRKKEDSYSTAYLLRCYKPFLSLYLGTPNDAKLFTVHTDTAVNMI